MCLNRPERPNITVEPMSFDTLSKSGETLLEDLDSWRKGVSDPADYGTLSEMGMGEREDLSMVARCV